MLMMGNKDKAVGLILKGLGGKEAASDDSEKVVPRPVENDYSEGRKMAAQDVLSAIQANDPARLASALIAIVEMASMEDD